MEEEGGKTSKAKTPRINFCKLSARRKTSKESSGASAVQASSSQAVQERERVLLCNDNGGEFVHFPYISISINQQLLKFIGKLNNQVKDL